MQSKKIQSYSAKQVSSGNSSASDTQVMEKIKSKAYEFWEKEGKKPGNEWANWFKAEKAVKGRNN